VAHAGELERRVEALEERLRVAEDLLAIERLKARYGELVDRCYGPGGVVSRPELERLADQIADLFTEDAVWDGGQSLGRFEGREAIRGRFLEPRTSFAFHLFVSPRIEVTGDRASGSWRVLAPCTVGRERAYWMAGIERDEYRRVGGAWRHSRMELATVLFAPYERGWARRPRREGETGAGGIVKEEQKSGVRGDR